MTDQPSLEIAPTHAPPVTREAWALASRVLIALGIILFIGVLLLADPPTWAWGIPAVLVMAGVASSRLATARALSKEDAHAATKDAVERGTSLWRDALVRLRRNRMATLSMVILFLLVLLCFGQYLLFTFYPTWIGKDRASIAADSFFALHIDHTRTNEGESYQPPSRWHWFGTDTLGRDLFARTLYGGSVSFLVGIVGTLVSVMVGVSWGAIAGYAGGRTDEFMMRIVDILYGLPFLFLVILIMTLVNGLGNVASVANQKYAEAAAAELSGNEEQATKIRGEITADERTASIITRFMPPLVVVFVAIGLVSWLTMARITRGQVLSLREREFVVAARAIGAKPMRIIFRHIVPNLLGPVIVYSTLTIPEIMLSEAFLSFVGLGISEPNCSWGSLASEGLAGINVIKPYWWMMLYPAAMLSLALFCLNFIGDGLRDALDPKSK